ncbi:MAG: adenylate/guanylate cyclase domain-containing protein [Nitrospirae bacterium]|nr:adenylate/guanylate cyclase domain-containing protein [Nitrospirota bacterium]
MAMDQGEMQQLDADALRKRLVDAERKYYANLHELQEQLTRLNAVQALSKLLIGYGDPASALDKLVELSVRDFGVEKAAILQPRESGYRVTALRGYSRRRIRELGDSVFGSEEQRITRVREGGRSQLFDSLDGDLAEVLDLSQMIVCPLRSDGGDFYGLYIVGFSAGKIALYRPFSGADLDFFDMVGSQVSALLQNIRLRDTFKKFVPRQFLDRLATRGLGNIALGEADSGVVTILFADIRSFTTLSEKLSPQEILNFLNTYFERMNAPIHANGGFIDKFIGDAIMGLFIDEDPSIGARNAVRSSLDMLASLHSLNEQRKRTGDVPISIGLGVHTGETVIGTVGSDDRMDSTVLGDAVNLASRIESLTKQFGAQILISSTTYGLIAGDPTIPCREIGLVNVRGREKAETIYEVLCRHPHDSFDVG